MQHFQVNGVTFENEYFFAIILEVIYTQTFATDAILRKVIPTQF